MKPKNTETKWIDLEEKKPSNSEFCYFTDGKSVTIGIWYTNLKILKGNRIKPTKWAPMNEPEPKLK